MEAPNQNIEQDQNIPPNQSIEPTITSKYSSDIYSRYFIVKEGLFKNMKKLLNNNTVCIDIK